MNKLEELADLIQENHRVNIMSKTRESYTSDFRIAAFSVMLTEYPAEIIMDMLGKNRTCLYHYRKRLAGMEYDPYLAYRYRKVRKLFLKL